jgi:hypothetical protein
MRLLRWSRRVLIVAGALVMGYAVFGALRDPDGRPVGHLLFLVGVLLAHDGVLLPAAIGSGVLIGRYAPAAARVAVRVSAFVTASLLVVAVPLTLGFGRRPDDPSALPLPYGRGLALTVVLVWVAALAAALVRRRRSAGEQVNRSTRPGTR